MSERRCRECVACCTILYVPELNKPAGTTCQHLTKRGCGIYETRPQSCRDFRCGWHLGAGANADRPDKSGVMLTAVEPSPEIRALGVPYLVQAHEVWDGATASRAGRAFDHVRRWASERLVVVIPRNGGPREFLGPPELVEKVKPIVRAALDAARGRNREDT